MNTSAARHERDRRGGDERENYPRKGPRPEPAREPARTTKQLNEYFIDGEGISREVLQIDICKHLGPEATCRPGLYNAKKGFYVKALRPFTAAQLEDLRAASEGYHNEAEISRRSGQDPREYEYSRTRQQFNQDIPMSEAYYPGNIYSQGASSYAPSNPYPPVSGPGYPSLSYASNPSFPAYSISSSSAAVPATMYSNMQVDDPRYPPNYIYSQTNQGYPQERYPQYPPDTRYEAQQPPRGYGPSVQDPTGRPYYEPSTPPNAYNPNPAPPYPRQGQGQPPYEPPSTRDTYRAGQQQNQYDGRRLR